MYTSNPKKLRTEQKWLAVRKHKIVLYGCLIHCFVDQVQSLLLFWYAWPIWKRKRPSNLCMTGFPCNLSAISKQKICKCYFLIRFRFEFIRQPPSVVLKINNSLSRFSISQFSFIFFWYGRTHRWTYAQVIYRVNFGITAERTCILWCGKK